MTAPNQNTQALTVAPKREIRVVEDNSSLSFIMDTAKFEHCYRIAEAMSKASLIPRHLKGATAQETAANCFLVVNQALRWHMDPFAVAPETYEVGGKLGYQGKLVAAVINTRAGLIDKLSYEFSGQKGTDAFEVKVSGRFDGEDEPRTVTVSVGQAKTSNSMWTKDPEQKLVYTGSIRWARRHAPEIIMGVTIDDDLEMMREEAKIIAMKPVKRPSFEGPTPPRPETITAQPSGAPLTEQQVERAKGRGTRPTMVEEPLDSPTPPTPPVAQPVPEPAPVEEKPEDAIAKLCAASGITNEQLMKFLKVPKEHWLNEKQTKITEMSPMKIRALVAALQSAEFVNRIKKASEAKP